MATEKKNFPITTFAINITNNILVLILFILFILLIVLKAKM
jgi:hypothetical protein